MPDPSHPHNIENKKLEKTLKKNIDLEKPTPETTTPPSAEVEFSDKEKESVPIQKKEENFLEESISSLTKNLKSNKKKQTQVPQIRDEITLQIEKVLEEDLADVYRELTPVQQQEFKMKGEQAAYAIRELMKSTHIKVKKIFKIILEWLKMLPGINKFFLEQEAKIKTDKILAIKNKKSV